MLLTVLISFAVVAVVFVVVNKYTKKTEQPVVPTIEEEPLGYETSSLASVIEREEPATPVVPEIVEEQPKPKAKKKMSAKPKAKAPKKKKDA